MLLICMIITGFSIMQAQNINKVQAVDEGRFIKVSYVVSGLKFNESLITSLYISTDGGNTYLGPMKEVTGQTGKGIRNGYHEIFWDARKELPFAEAELVFDVRGVLEVEVIRKRFFSSLTGNPITPIGLRFGQLGKTGWYVEARSSLSPMQDIKFDFKDNHVVDYDEPGYYKFSDYHGYSSIALLGGLTLQAGRSVFFNFGIGYALEDCLFQIEEYTYDSNTMEGKSYVRDLSNSYSGFELDAGMILRFNHLLISGTATYLNLSKLGWTAGVGISF